MRVVIGKYNEKFSLSILISPGKCPSHLKTEGQNLIKIPIPIAIKPIHKKTLKA